jgi:predicted NAD/FAD-binding protein
MSFAVSRCDGALEYAGTSLATLFAQRVNVVKPRFWAMLSDLRRFYREAPRDLKLGRLGGMTLGDYLQQNDYGDAFQHDHLLPMASAIWSAPAGAMRECAAAEFVRFFENHGLLLLRDRPPWRTVRGGSRTYVDKLLTGLPGGIRRNARVGSIARTGTGVQVVQTNGDQESFDHVVIATHSDEALAMLREPSPDETRLLGAIRYRQNRVVLHTDRDLMPKRRSVWSSWNYVHSGASRDGSAQITYWMNRLQGLPENRPLFVTLDPIREPRSAIHTEVYAHPVFDASAHRAQRKLWTLQGRFNTWFCGAYFGAGFHEDGLQAGLAVAEQLGGVRRPWNVPNESARIHCRTSAPLPRPQEAA